ncbi:MAG: 2-oxoglutarate dehydrogenase complex dihydrolipoyllysine-residue succinyltransferase [Verrucomicrobia bacterium]|nr:2-oxoglutarate dehydrogenase complex dihydrolipoyllysine-residue succinyltransferase [Verrucomicrobiota bacterium]
MIDIKVPAVGESISSGVISAFHKKSGDFVKANDPIFTMDTDKVSTEVVAETSGVLTVLAKEGDEVKIGQVVARIDPAGAPSAAAAAAPAPAAPAAAPAPAAAAPAVHVGEQSPAVRRLLEEEKLDPSAISATGKGGRLTKGDVLEHLASGAKAAPAPAPEPAPAPAPAPAAIPAPAAEDSHGTVVEATPAPAGPAPAPAPAAEAAPESPRTTRKKLTPMRKKIAAHLVNAQHTAAILSTFNEVDMSAVMALRARLQESFTKKHGVKLGFMSFFVKAVVEALKAVPAINGQMDGDDYFIQNHYYDISVAVGTDRGLVVPVLRDCDQKSFADIERELGGLATKAREGKLTLQDLSGGVFTISNGGTYGSLLGTPIINPPQSGILGMHKIEERPVAINGKVEIRPMMYLALSYDHRVIDGKEGVTFLVRVKECIEDPSRLLFGC